MARIVTELTLSKLRKKYPNRPDYALMHIWNSQVINRNKHPREKVY